MTGQSPKTVEATVNSFKILKTLVAADRPLGVTELADTVGLSKGVVYNHLGTLSELGYVRQEGRKYRPSFRLLSLGERARSNRRIYRVARPHLDNLANTTGATATLFVEEDGLGICVYRASRTDSLPQSYVCGDALPLHVTAPGKAILASLDSDRVEEIVARHGLPSETENTISTRQSLEEELQSIRDDGIAFSREEQFEGVIGVGTSFDLDLRAPAAAIGVCGSLDRLSGRYLREDITGQVISTAKSIQVELTK